MLKYEDMNQSSIIVRSIIKHLLTEVIESRYTLDVETCADILVILSNSSQVLCETFTIENMDLQKYYNGVVALNENSIIKVCVETIDQSQSENWFEIRRLRISASQKAHSIKIRTKKTSDELATYLTSSNRSITSKSMEYGQKNEKKALKEYTQIYKKNC